MFYNKRKLCTFSTIEEFWAVYLYLKRPSSIRKCEPVPVQRWAQHCSHVGGLSGRGLLAIEDPKKSAERGVSILGTIWHDLVFALIEELSRNLRWWA